MLLSKTELAAQWALPILNLPTLKKKHRKNVQKIQKIFKMSEHHKTPTTTSITIIPANCMRTENTKNFLSLFLVQRLL